uniref:Uncharacterized protein n=1 Tax=Heterorhabditis bacteriophora TaxID=37862 RepID=A0A1I7WJB4_HETBA
MDVSAAILIRSSWVVIEERWPTKSFPRQRSVEPRPLTQRYVEPRPLTQRSTPASPSGEERIYAQFFFSFLRASKALRKPLTTSGWTRPELPSGKGR